ncbi:MAG: hypothetical protein Ct9H300mP21_07130 [Pseudomonadota bacterium]|nr:MAG: hypothetical protein Ct9H300mP21_07130 [Pseudomonadota bacterium]
MSEQVRQCESVEEEFTRSKVSQMLDFFGDSDLGENVIHAVLARVKGLRVERKV